MSTAANNVPAGGPGRARLRRVGGLVLLSAGVLLGVAVAYLSWLRLTAAEPPAVELSHVEAPVAEAIEAARAQVRKYPRWGAAWGELGMVFFAHDFYEQGQTCFARAEEFDPGEPRWPYLQGLCWSKLGPDRVVPCLERAAARCGPDPTPRLALGEALLEQGRPAEAEEQFRRALEWEPVNARANLGMGRVAVLHDDPRAALDYLHQSAAQAGGVRATHDLLAQVYHRLGDRAAAEEERRRAARAGPHPAWPDRHLEEVAAREVGLLAASRRGSALLRDGRTAEAVAVFRGLVRDYPDSGRVHYGLGKALLMHKDWPGAEAELREAIRRDPELVDSHAALGAALAQQGKHDEAVPSYRRAVELQPQNATAHFELGQSLIRLGDRRGALEAFREAVRYSPDSAPARKSLGVLLATEGKVAEAVEHLSQAAALNPSDQSVKALLEQLQARP